MIPEIRPTDVDEAPLSGEPAADLVARLAAAKATAVACHDDEVVLAADTEVVLDGQPLGKPADDQDAARMLRMLSGRRHEVLTGIAVRRGAVVRQHVVTTGVIFRSLDHTEIAWYVATGEPRDKAGAYGLQGAGAALVERIEGSDTNVIGLPLGPTVELLRTVGVDVWRAGGPRLDT